MKPFTHRLPLAAALTACLLGSLSASAATVAHWRFEATPGFLNDSAGSNTLTNNGSVTQVASPFSDPVPQTGAANDDAASFSGSNYLTAADNAAFTSNQFTLEAFFTTGDVTGSSTRLIAGHHGSGGSFDDERSFSIGVTDSQFRLLLGNSSGTAMTPTDVFTLANNTLYYAAAAVDLTAAGNSSITMYLKDLTNDTALQIATDDATPTSLFNAAAPFSIGSTAQGTALFTGTIDEVRLSNTQLAQSELLIIPEPSSLALMAIALCAGLAWRRDRRA